jgi:hypothetical protein
MKKVSRREHFLLKMIQKLSDQGHKNGKKMTYSRWVEEVLSSSKKYVDRGIPKDEKRFYFANFCPDNLKKNTRPRHNIFYPTWVYSGSMMMVFLCLQRTFFTFDDTKFVWPRDTSIMSRRSFFDDLKIVWSRYLYRKKIFLPEDILLKMIQKITRPRT